MLGSAARVEGRTEGGEDDQKTQGHLAVPSSCKNGDAVCDTRQQKRYPNCSECQLLLSTSVEHVRNQQADLHMQKWSSVQMLDHAIRQRHAWLHAS